MKKTKKSKQHNFMGEQVRVSSQMNPAVWETELKDYWDSQLCKLITYGFPLDFDYDHTLKCENKNHNSALMFKNDVHEYIKEEKEYGAIFGPFVKEPSHNMHFPLSLPEKSQEQRIEGSLQT